MHPLGDRTFERRSLKFEVQAFGITSTPDFADNPNASIGARNLFAITSTVNTLGGQRKWWFGGQISY